MKAVVRCFGASREKSERSGQEWVGRRQGCCEGSSLVLMTKFSSAGVAAGKAQ